MRRLWRTGAALVLLVLVPSALAGFGSKGGYEPDTRLDVISGLMQLDAQLARQHGHHLYFNGFLAAAGGVSTTVNPNLALLKTSFQTVPFVPAALFGIWRDCNGDGYVGMADNGALEYRAELLFDLSVCPPGPVDPAFAWANANDGQWVVEFAPIGYDDVTTGVDENVVNLNDTLSRVWADWGRPGDAPGLICALSPAPYGSFRSTGGLLRYADCQTGHRGAATVTTLAAAAGMPELGFGDAPPHRPDQSSSPLNQPNPWGSESDATMATLFDCADPAEVEVYDPTGGGLRTILVVTLPGGSTFYVNGTDSEGRIVNLTVNDPAPAFDPRGSPAGTVNETEAGLTDCDRTDPDEVVDLDGRPDGSDGDLPYALEGPNEPVSPHEPRRRTDHAFRFEEGSRGRGVPALVLGGRARDDAGLGTAAVTGFWVATTPSVLGRNPFVSRSDAGPEGVTYVTFYAYVSHHFVTSLPLTLAPVGGGSYGAEACSKPQPVFECDPDLWWRDTSGNSIVPRDPRLGGPSGTGGDPAEIGVRVGQRYQLRDVDCIDSSLQAARASGVHWGVLTATQCDRP